MPHRPGQRMICKCTKSRTCERFIQHGWPHMFQALHVLPKPLLPLTQLATTDIVGSQIGHHRVNDQQLEWLLNHDRAEAIQQICAGVHRS